MPLPRIRLQGSSLVTLGALVIASTGTVSAQSDSSLNSNDVRELYSQDGFSDSHEHADPASLPRNVDLEAIRDGLRNAGRQAQSLYERLRAQDSQVSGIRQLSGDLFRLHVRADYLARRITSRDELERNLADLKELDSTWRRLSYKLGLINGLDGQTRSLIHDLDETSGRLTQALQIGPSVDFRELVSATNGLTSALDRLLWDLDYAGESGGQNRQLRADGENLKQQAAHLADGAFHQFEHDHLVSDFKTFQTSWSSYLERLRELHDPRVERDVQIVNDYQRQVASLLWMKQTLDRAQMIYLVEQLRDDVDQFFGNAPLKMLMRLPESDRALATADAFYGNFENFVDVANRGENRDDLQYAFQFIDEAWRDFAQVYRPLQSSEAQQVLGAIEKDVSVLRDALLIQDDYDRRKASELASQVATLSDYIERDTQNWIREARVPNASEIERDVSRYRNHARHLHEAISGGAGVREIRQLTAETFDDWRRVYEHIIHCRTDERSSLASSSSQTTPALMDLRSIFSE